ncbi:MAG: hypothetical protein EP345_17615 [Sphingomonadales bacterium]|nr:MAG: hypothetical protein EP345_17615 [Sphingomonadales bacterium]
MQQEAQYQLAQALHRHVDAYGAAQIHSQNHTSCISDDSRLARCPCRAHMSDPDIDPLSGNHRMRCICILIDCTKCDNAIAIGSDRLQDNRLLIGVMRGNDKASTGWR